MNLFILFVFMAMFGAVKFEFLSKKQLRSTSFCLVYGTLCLLLVMYSALRFRVGIDTISYMENYHQVPSLLDLTNNTFSLLRYQPLWIIYVSLIKTIFGDDFMFLQFFNSLIINVVVFYFFYKNTKYPFFAISFYLLLFYLEFNFEIMRESIAISIFLISLPFLRKRKFIYYFICIVIAYGFHVSAIICFIVPFMLFFSINKFALFMLVVLFSFNSYFYYSIIDYFSLFSSGKLLENINNYSKISALESGFNIFGYLYMLLFSFIIPFVIIVINMHFKIFDISKYGPYIYMMMIISLLSINIGIFNRFINYIYMIYILFLVQFIVNVSKSINHGLYFSYFIIILLFIKPIYRFISPLDSDRMPDHVKYYTRYFPYESIFDEKYSLDREAYYNQIKY